MHHAKWAGNLSSNEWEDKKGFWIVNYVPSTGVDRLAKILVFINFIAAFFCSLAVPLRSLYFSSRLLSKRKHWRARSKRSLKWRLNARLRLWSMCARLSDDKDNDNNARAKHEYETRRSRKSRVRKIRKRSRRAKKEGAERIRINLQRSLLSVVCWCVVLFEIHPISFHLIARRRRLFSIKNH